MKVLEDLINVATGMRMNCNVERNILTVKWLNMGSVWMTSATFSHQT